MISNMLILTINIIWSLIRLILMINILNLITNNGYLKLMCFIKGKQVWLMKSCTWWNAHKNASKRSLSQRNLSQEKPGLKKNAMLTQAYPSMYPYYLTKVPRTLLDKSTKLVKKQGASPSSNEQRKARIWGKPKLER